MDGLARVVGGSWPLVLAGRTVMVRPVTLGMLGACEARLLAARKNPFEQCVELVNQCAMAPEVAEKLLQKARNDLKTDKSLRIVTWDALRAWTYTRDGINFTAHLTCAPHPGFATPEDAAITLRQGGQVVIDEFVRARDGAASWDLLSSLDWPDLPPPRSQRPRHGQAERPRPPKYYPWRKVFRHYATEYGWTPEQVGALTLYQHHLYTCDESMLGGTKRVGKDELPGQAGKVTGGPRTRKNLERAIGG